MNELIKIIKYKYRRWSFIKCKGELTCWFGGKGWT